MPDVDLFQVVSSVTASLRFQGALNVDLNEIQTNLVKSFATIFLIQSKNHHVKYFHQVPYPKIFPSGALPQNPLPSCHPCPCYRCFQGIQALVKTFQQQKIVTKVRQPCLPFNLSCRP